MSTSVSRRGCGDIDRPRVDMVVGVGSKLERTDPPGASRAFTVSVTGHHVTPAVTQVTRHKRIVVQKIDTVVYCTGHNPYIP